MVSIAGPRLIAADFKQTRREDQRCTSPICHPIAAQVKSVICFHEGATMEIAGWPAGHKTSAPSALAAAPAVTAAIVMIGLCQRQGNQRDKTAHRRPWGWFSVRHLCRHIMIEAGGLVRIFTLFVGSGDSTAGTEIKKWPSWEGC